MKKEIKVGSVVVLVSRIESGGKAGSYRVQGSVDGKHKVFGIYKGLDKAERVARETALSLQRVDDALSELTEPQRRMCVDALEAGMTCEDVRAWVDSRDRVEVITVAEMFERWFDAKTRRNDYSLHHIRAMKYSVKRVPEYLGKGKMCEDVTTRNLDDWLNSLGVSPKSVKNHRGTIVSAWKWAVSQGYASENVAAGIEVPKARRKPGGHEVLLPSEFALMLHNVTDHFLPWLAIGGFAGLRNSEICGSPGKMEDRLKWEDFDWINKRITVREETAKVPLTRFVPMCDSLVEWLEPWKNKSGYVHNSAFPYHYASDKTESETYKLGSLIGGWRNNCLRASRQSYRLADTGDIGTTAEEGGHSASELRSTYLNPRYKEDAKEWFSLSPSKLAADGNKIFDGKGRFTG